MLALTVGDGNHRHNYSSTISTISIVKIKITSSTMDFDAGIPMSRASVVTEGSSSLDQDALWPINLRSLEPMEAGAYPVREGEPDCSYYIRTGLCRYGATCRFNHPPNRKLAIATARMRGEYPERIGQPECEYYLKTGTCKFGATCKFHHPREKAGVAGRVTLNILGYPLRPVWTSNILSLPHDIDYLS